MEIESASLDFIPPSMEDDEKIPMGKITKVGSIFCLVIAAGAFIPAAIKKRKVTIIHAPENILSIESIEEDFPTCTPEMREKAYRVFNMVADGQFFRPSHIAELLLLKKEIDPIHPFCLLKIMHENPENPIKRIMLDQGILRATKISETLKGLKHGMEREIRQCNIESYLPELAKKLSKETSELRRLIQVRDWKGFVFYLYDIPLSNDG